MYIYICIQYLQNLHSHWNEPNITSRSLRLPFLFSLLRLKVPHSSLMKVWSGLEQQTGCWSSVMNLDKTQVISFRVNNSGIKESHRFWSSQFKWWSAVRSLQPKVNLSPVWRRESVMKSGTKDCENFPHRKTPGSSKENNPTKIHHWTPKSLPKTPKSYTLPETNS